jgi:hypothetical protein
MITVEDIKKELRNALNNGEELADIEDSSGEWVDGFLPVYNNRIIEEWQNMPSEYDDRGWAELGNGGEINIVNLMMLDLYMYYSDLFNEAIAELTEELETQEEANA